MTRRRNHTRPDAIVDALYGVADALSSGDSLRQALLRSAVEADSPLAPVSSALAEGRPLAPTLRAAALSPNPGDTAVSSALCVLAVHAEAGGDPLAAVRSLAARLARRQAARDEARALTTQARLGARAILVLTPAFLGLLALSDPRGAARWFGDPHTRLAIGAGLLLQGLGALWIRTIVRAPGGSPRRYARLPFVRVVSSIARGRERSTLDLEVAGCAETIAFALDAGLSPTAALRVVAPCMRGRFAEAVRAASGVVVAPIDRALAEVAQVFDDEVCRRFARAFERSASLGVPLAPALRALADDTYTRASTRLHEDVRRATVRVLVPLSLLVLPAFVLACLVPLFVGGLQQVAG